jgi:hypothetical protein
VVLPEVWLTSRVRGALVDSLVPEHHSIHAGACVSKRRETARHRGRGLRKARRGVVAPHGAGGAATALASRVGAPDRNRRVRALVNVAPATSAARLRMSLAQAHPTPT